MSDKTALVIKTIDSLKTSGIKGTAKKTAAYVQKKIKSTVSAGRYYEPLMDVLFINGCDREAVPHPPRYRVTHQREQLAAANISTNEVFFADLKMEQVRFYRAFVFFRCPYTSLIGDFIAEAKKLHKTVLFDVDDLVIDTKYTNNTRYVQGLNGKDRAVYDDGVIRMGKTLSLCDAAITTTERLAEELRHYVPEVYINRNVASELMYKLSEQALKNKALQDGMPDERVNIGYFSGSITHNADFELILPALIKVLNSDRNVYLHVVGELELPEQLKSFEKQIVKRKFVDWQKLPELIASVDINLAPLEKSVFNEAKSENKWIEAALVKVPTIASNFGAFKRMIQHGITGLLCDTVEEWYSAMSVLVNNTEERMRLAENAYRFCKKYCLSLYTAHPIADYIKGKMSANIAFLLPSINISGGVMVALRHAGILYEHGLDVFLVSEEKDIGWVDFEKYHFPVVSRYHNPISQRLDKAVATMWNTVSFLEIYPNIEKRYYLVQNFEPDFYQPDIYLRIQASQTYYPLQEITFLTISRWCQKWLLEYYNQAAKYAPNGIHADVFRPHKRDLTGKVRILIEGDSLSYYKNVDESFRIAEHLDPERFEVWYMSYYGKPKDQYRVDRFLHAVPYEKVFEVYYQCDILIKSSFLESFSYPPLEMMASGGYALVVLNEGNSEYLKDRKNCLIYELGNVEQAVNLIYELCSTQDLQDRLYECGLETAEKREWNKIETDIVNLYS